MGRHGGGTLRFCLAGTRVLAVGSMLCVAAGMLRPGPAFGQEVADPLAELSTQMRACRTDRQCVLVDSIPCSCSSGGRQLAINREYLEFWRGVFGLWGTQKPIVVCALIYNCTAQQALCMAGQCVAR